MATSEDFRAHLEEFGVQVEDGPLEEFRRLAVVTDKSPEEMALEFISYCSKHGVTYILNSHLLEAFQGHFMKKKSQTPSRSKKNPRTPSTKRPRPRINEDQDLSSTYGISFVTPMKQPAARSTPRTARKPRLSLSSAMESPAAAKFTDRMNRGQLQTAFNGHLPAGPEFAIGLSEQRALSFVLSLWNENSNDKKYQDIAEEKDLDNPILSLIGTHRISLRRGNSDVCSRFMYEEHFTKVNAIQDRMELLGSRLLEKMVAERKSESAEHKEVDTKEAETEAVLAAMDEELSDAFDFVAADEASQNSAFVLGRILDEGSKLNKASLMIEGDSRRSLGNHVKLDVSQLQSFLFFPGQMLGIDGINSSGKEIVAQKVYTDAQAKENKWKSDSSVEKRTQSFLTLIDQQGGQPMQILVAGGPLMLKAGLDYYLSPLYELASVICRKHPDLVVLMGPFIANDHDLVVSDELDVSYNTAFNSLLQDFIMQVKEGEYAGHIVLIPSTDDVHHVSAFPQGAYQVKFDQLEATEYYKEHVRSLGNPCEFQASGVTFAVTNEDVLVDLSARCLLQGNGDRISRLASQIIHQQHFYPIDAPKQDVRLDYTHHQRLCLKHTPDILILKSVLRPFAKKLDGDVLCVNPSKLSKGTSGGQFAIITIDSPRNHLKNEFAMDVDSGENEQDVGLESENDMWSDLSKLCRVDFVKI